MIEDTAPVLTSERIYILMLLCFSVNQIAMLITVSICWCSRALGSRQPMFDNFDGCIDQVLLSIAPISFLQDAPPRDA